jgi:hypothetical protein
MCQVWVAAAELKSSERGISLPAPFRERPQKPNTYLLGVWMRSDSDVVATPGSIAMPWIVLPDWATII